MTAPAPASTRPDRTGRPTDEPAEPPVAEGGAAEAVVVERGRFDGLAAVLRAAGAWMRGVWQALWSRIGPAVRVVTLLGWVLLAGGAALLAAGLVLRWIEAIVVGALAIVAVLAAIPFIVGRTAYDVEIELNPRRVTVGDRALGRVTVRNAGERPSLPTLMEFPVGRGRAEFGIPALEPGAPHEELFAVPTSKRAVIPAGPARSVRGDQLGILRRTVKWTGVIDLFVHPRTVRLQPSAAGLLRDLEGVTTTKITDHDLAFHALRPYEPGDDRRHIHWKTSARTGTLMVRQFEETRRSQLTVIHTLDRAGYADEEEFELAISVFASIVQQVLREDLDIGAVNETGIIPTRSIVSMLDATSRFEPVAREHDSLRAYVVDATRPLPPPTVVLLIGGSGLTPHDLRQVQVLYPQEVTVTAFRCDVGARVGRAKMRDLTICTVTELDDLPRLLRRKGLV